MDGLNIVFPVSRGSENLGSDGHGFFNIIFFFWGGGLFQLTFGVKSARKKNFDKIFRVGPLSKGQSGNRKHNFYSILLDDIFYVKEELKRQGCSSI